MNSIDIEDKERKNEKTLHTEVGILSLIPNQRTKIQMFLTNFSIFMYLGDYLYGYNQQHIALQGFRLTGKTGKSHGARCWYTMPHLCCLTAHSLH